MNVANRKYSILHSNTAEINDNTKKQGNNDFSPEEAHKLLTELNNKLKTSQDIINDLQVKLNKKNDEFIKLKEEYDKLTKGNNNTTILNVDEVNSNDKHRLLLIEAVIINFIFFRTFKMKIRKIYH